MWWAPPKSTTFFDAAPYRLPRKTVKLFVQGSRVKLTAEFYRGFHDKKMVLKIVAMAALNGKLPSCRRYPILNAD